MTNNSKNKPVQIPRYNKKNQKLKKIIPIKIPGVSASKLIIEERKKNR